MAGTKILLGAFLISGTSPLSSSAPAISGSRETLVTRSQKRFGEQQDKKRRRGKKLKKKLGIGVKLDLRKLKGQKGGFFAKEISSDGWNNSIGGSISETSQALSYTEDREPTKKPNYTKEEQQKTRDKVFREMGDEIVEKYKRPENVWWSPDKDLDAFKVGNDAVELLVETTFTSDEKWGVKNRLKDYWCSSSEGKYGEATEYFRPKLLDATYSIWDLSGNRSYFYYWGLDFCNGKQHRYPNWSDSTWPGVDIEHSLRGAFLA